jgi:hypothetical protein
MMADSPLQFTAMIGGSKLERICCPGLETHRITINNRIQARVVVVLKVHKNENFFDSDFGICVISLLVMSKY